MIVFAQFLGLHGLPAALLIIIIAVGATIVFGSGGGEDR